MYIKTDTQHISWIKNIRCLNSQAKKYKIYNLSSKKLTDTGENVQKWTRVFSIRRWVILVARTRRKKEKKIACPLLDVFACGQVSSPRLYRLSQFWPWCHNLFKCVGRVWLDTVWIFSTSMIFTFERFNGNLEDNLILLSNNFLTVSKTTLTKIILCNFDVENSTTGPIVINQPAQSKLKFVDFIYEDLQ